MSEALGPLSGTKTISASNTPERVVAATASKVVRGIALKAYPTNVGLVRVGDATVGATGWPIQEPVAMDVPDLANVYVYGNAGDKVYWLGLVV